MDVDDLSIAETINRKTQLSPSPIEERPQPVPYRARTGLKINNKDSKVYHQLLETNEYAETNKMKLNFQKTKLMLFKGRVQKKNSGIFH